MNCELCDAVNEERVIMRNEFAYAIIAKGPQVPYHSLVLPIRHVTKLSELKPNESYALNELLDKLTTKIKDVLECSPMIAMNDETYKTQPHLHYHVLPIKEGLRTVISSHLNIPERTNASEAEMEEMARKLKQ